jgi:hypothetical protein
MVRFITGRFENGSFILADERAGVWANTFDSRDQALGALAALGWVGCEVHSTSALLARGVELAVIAENDHAAANHRAAVDHCAAQLAAAITTATDITDRVPLKPTRRTFFMSQAAMADFCTTSTAHYVYLAAATAAWRAAAEYALNLRLTEQGVPSEPADLYLSDTENRVWIAGFTLDQARAAAQAPQSYPWVLRRGFDLQPGAGAA